MSFIDDSCLEYRDIIIYFTIYLNNIEVILFKMY